MFRRIKDALSSKKRALRVTVVVMLLALTFSLVACAGSIPTLEAPAPTSSPELNPPAVPAIAAEATTADTFRVTDLEVYPTEVKSGEQILVTASIVNTGDLEANYTVELKVNEIVKFTTEVKLPAGDTSDLQVVGREVVPGIYTVSLGRLTRQFVVRELAEPQDGGGPILLGSAEPENIVTEPEQNAGACCGGGSCGCGGSSPSQSDNGPSSQGGCGCGQQTKILPGDIRQY
jgi:hypothetical protein